MTTPVRFHLDENVSDKLASALRRRGINVTTTAEVGLTGATDLEQLDYARRENRVVVTQDRDFLRAHARSADHAGIAYCNHGEYSIGGLLHRLLLIYELLSAEEMMGSVEYL